ncbi:MAG: alpha/beta fold hydrolase [Phycisphaerales bacterium]
MGNHRRVVVCVSSLLLVLAAITNAAFGRQGACPPGWGPAFVVDPAEYPFAHQCVELEHGVVHYLDEGPRVDPVGTAILFHGNPTWSFMYREVVADLVADGWRVIAPDLYGFGLSDKPDPDSFAYSARSHADAMTAFVQALEVRDAVLVVHDWGGPIGFTVAGREASRFRGVVVLNTWAWPITPENAALFHDSLDWVNTNVTRSEAMIASGVLPRRVGESLALLHGPRGSAAYDAVRDAYWAPFLEVDTGRPRSDDHMQPTNRPYHFLSSDPALMLEAEAGVIAMSDRPVFFVIGARDALLGALRCDASAAQVCPDASFCRVVDGLEVCIDERSRQARFPALEEFLSRWDAGLVRGVTIARDASHFVAEYEPEAIADAVRAVGGG